MSSLPYLGTLANGICLCHICMVSWLFIYSRDSCVGGWTFSCIYLQVFVTAHMASTSVGVWHSPEVTLYQMIVQQIAECFHCYVGLVGFGEVSICNTEQPVYFYRIFKGLIWLWISLDDSLSQALNFLITLSRIQAHQQFLALFFLSPP